MLVSAVSLYPRFTVHERANEPGEDKRTKRRKRKRRELKI
jgi:hypothetical protein